MAEARWDLLGDEVDVESTNAKGDSKGKEVHKLGTFKAIAPP